MKTLRDPNLNGGVIKAVEELGLNKRWPRIEK